MWQSIDVCETREVMEDSLYDLAAGVDQDFRPARDSVGEVRQSRTMTSSAAADASVTDRFRAARDLLVDLREDYDRAVAEFTLPRRGRPLELGDRLVRRRRPRQRPRLP